MVLDANGNCGEPAADGPLYSPMFGYRYDTYQQGGLHCGYRLYVDNRPKNGITGSQNFTVFVYGKTPEQKDVYLYG